MKKRAIVLTSTAPRHQYFSNMMDRNFSIEYCITEKKKSYYEMQRSQSSIVQQHFEELTRAEQNIFNVDALFDVPCQLREVPDINDLILVKDALDRNIDVILLFGTSILNDAWLEAFPGRIINLHLGLSPYYRGSATLFWPFYYRELACLGTTVHLAEKKVDAGDILRRIKPDLSIGSSYYQVTNDLIRKSIDLMPSVIKEYLDGAIQIVPQEKVEGRLCRKADFTEAALQQVLSECSTGITTQHLLSVQSSELCRCSQ